MKKNTNESYIVRVYRRGEGDADEFVGTVENPCAQCVEAFRTKKELLDILNDGHKGQQHADGARKTGIKMPEL